MSVSNAAVIHNESVQLSSSIQSKYLLRPFIIVSVLPKTICTNCILCSGNSSLLLMVTALILWSYVISLTYIEVSEGISMGSRAYTEGHVDCNIWWQWEGHTDGHSW